MRLLAPSLALAGALLLTGCSGYHVKYDYDRRADFSTFKTFGWYATSRHAQGKGQSTENPLMDRRVRRAVEDELIRKGFRFEAKGEPDFLVTYYPTYSTRRVKTTTGFVGMGWGYRPFYGGVRSQSTQVHQYREGTIVLEIVDNRSNEMVFQAAAEGALNEVETPEEAEDVIQRAVAEMLESFPPKLRAPRREPPPEGGK